MNDSSQERIPLRKRLTDEFHDEEYRYAYAASFLNTKLAAQIKTIRQQRGMTQAEIASEMGIKQPGYARFEDVNHSVWKTDTLWDIARALGVRVNISFDTFGSLIDEKEHFDKDHLERPSFSDDPAFSKCSSVDCIGRPELAVLEKYQGDSNRQSGTLSILGDPSTRAPRQDLLTFARDRSNSPLRTGRAA